MKDEDFLSRTHIAYRVLELDLPEQDGDEALFEKIEALQIQIDESISDASTPGDDA